MIVAVLTDLTSVVCSVCSSGDRCAASNGTFGSARPAGNISKRTEQARWRAKLQALERTLLELPKIAALCGGSEELVPSWNPLVSRSISTC